MEKVQKDDFEKKLDEIVAFIIALASGDLAHRIDRLDDTSNDNSLDAVVEGMNMLAEELQETTVSRNRFKKLAAELEIAKTKAEMANEAKSTFLGLVSHEFRTPMNGIIGFTTILVDDPELTPSQRDSVGIILSCAKDLLHLINGILDLSAIEAGVVKLRMETFNLNECIESTKSAVSSLIAKKDIKLTTKVDPGAPTAIRSDEVRLKQILVNLISNATKFTNQGGSVAISVGMEQNESNKSMLHFQVEDTGIGIEKKYHKSIFDSFAQVDNALSREYKGTGLGLAICKELSAALGGKIWVESGIGEGSIFHCTIENHSCPN